MLISREIQIFNFCQSLMRPLRERTTRDENRARSTVGQLANKR